MQPRAPSGARQVQVGIRRRPGTPSRRGRAFVLYGTTGLARAHFGPYLRPAFELTPPSSPRGVTFATPIRAL